MPSAKLNRGLSFVAATLAAFVGLEPAVRAESGATLRRTTWKSEIPIVSIPTSSDSLPIVEIISISGSRRATVRGSQREIVDLLEKVVYTLNESAKTYVVASFARLAADGRGRIERGGFAAPSVQVRKTDETKDWAGRLGRKVVVTAAEQGSVAAPSISRLVVESEVWLATNAPELDEISKFNAQYEGLLERLPRRESSTSRESFTTRLDTLQRAIDAEVQKLRGIPIAARTVVKIPPPSGLAIRNPGLIASARKRQPALVSNWEYTSLRNTTSKSDVEVPTGYVRK